VSALGNMSFLWLYVHPCMCVVCLCACISVESVYFVCNEVFYTVTIPSITRLLVLSSSQTEDKAAIIDLERKLKKEVDARSRVDAELREHRHAITNAFTQEELAGLRKKVQEQHHEMEKMREQLKEQKQTWEHRHLREVRLLHCKLPSILLVVHA